MNFEILVKPLFQALPFLLVGFFSQNGAAATKGTIKIVTTVPDIAWTAAQVGGDLVDANSLLSGKENPHYVDAVPDFVRQVADADIVCLVGLDLEVGYMPPVLSRSGNATVQPGGSGYCEAGKSVTVLEKAEGPIDRSMGDVHPSGNPHFYLSPGAMAQASKEIAASLSKTVPAEKEKIAARQAAFEAKLNSIGEQARAKLKSFVAEQSKPLIIEYHREFAYYFDYYGLQSFGSIEEKPGVPPSAGRLAEVALAAKAAGVRLVLATDYAPQRTLKKFSELSGIPVVTVPTMMQKDGPQKTYEELQLYIADQIATTGSAAQPSL